MLAPLRDNMQRGVNLSLTNNRRSKCQGFAPAALA